MIKIGDTIEAYPMEIGSRRIIKKFGKTKKGVVVSIGEPGHHGNLISQYKMYVIEHADGTREMISERQL